MTTTSDVDRALTVEGSGDPGFGEVGDARAASLGTAGDERRIHHLVRPVEWPAAGEYRPPSLAAEGFVHFSFTDQVEGSANRHFADADALVAVEVDPTELDVRVEDSDNRGTAYPHVYGSVPVTAARAIRRLRRDAVGRWTFTHPSGGGSAVASPDR